MPVVRRAQSQAPAPAAKSKAPAKSSRKPKAEVVKAARAPSRAPKKTAPSEPHKVVQSPAEKQALRNIQIPGERRPKEGEIVLFCEGAETCADLKWFLCANVSFRFPDGTKGKVDWVCTTPEALKAAGNDPFAVRYVGATKFKEPPPERVIELPAPPVAMPLPPQPHAPKVLGV